ncbi:MAG TPA: rubredoxin [Bacteroidales bacterium]|nr:rubredoxin [Bacteroidales bacterium]
MNIYRCIVCCYEYNPDEVDIAGGIDNGTSFNDLPDDWVCPVCGAPTNEFEEIS